MLAYHYYDEEKEDWVFYEEPIVVEPYPSKAWVDAAKVVLRDKWFREECENGNYHGLHDWISECIETASKELEILNSVCS